MKFRTRLVIGLSAAALLGGCSTTTISNRTSNVGDHRIARPAHIYVHDFAATPADMVVPGHGLAASTLSAQEVSAGRDLGSEIATSLVHEIREMGLPGEHGATSTQPSIGDIVITGYFTSIDEGNRAKRMMVGFGSGAAEVQTHVDGYLVTEGGWKKLGSGTVAAGGGGNGPGMVAPIAVTVATANPIGLVVGGAVKVAGEASGRSTIEGAGKRTASQIAVELEKAFERQGWI